MERREYLKQAVVMGCCAAGLFLNTPDATAGALLPDDDCKSIKQDKEFIQNWMTDLMDTMDEVLDYETKAKLMAGCGKGCYDRHKFKQDIAEKGKGNLDNLIAAYSKNFEIWKEDNKVHIRYGAVSKGCYCPAAKFRKPKENDIHCECTKNTHKTVFETALNKTVKIEILETVRRNGKTCHFVVEV
jgi:hypothetical protein